MCAISTQKKRPETLLQTSPRLLSSFFSGDRSTKFLNMFRKTASGPWASIQQDANFRKEKAKESRSFPLSKRMNRPACKTDIWILPQGTLTLVRPLTQRASDGLANTSKNDSQWFWSCAGRRTPLPRGPRQRDDRRRTTRNAMIPRERRAGVANPESQSAA